VLEDFLQYLSTARRISNNFLSGTQELETKPKIEFYSSRNRSTLDRGKPEGRWKEAKLRGSVALWLAGLACLRAVRFAWALQGQLKEGFVVLGRFIQGLFVSSLGRTRGLPGLEIQGFGWRRPIFCGFSS